MKIKDKTPHKNVKFSFLADGSVFKDEGRSIYLKLSKTVYESNEYEFCETYNAYDLTNNEFTLFSPSEPVEEVQAELVLTTFNETIT